MDVTDDDSRPHKRAKIEQDEVPLQNNNHNNSTTNAHDNMKEIEVGINTWIDNSRPIFHGLLKKRYTDFLVNEILLDGTVAHLRNVSARQSSDAKIAAATTTPTPPDHQDGNDQTASDGNKNLEQISISNPETPVLQNEDQAKTGGAEVTSPLNHISIFLADIPRFLTKTELS